MQCVLSAEIYLHSNVCGSADIAFHIWSVARMLSIAISIIAIPSELAKSEKKTTRSKRSNDSSRTNHPYCQPSEIHQNPSSHRTPLNLHRDPKCRVDVAEPRIRRAIVCFIVSVSNVPSSSQYSSCSTKRPSSASSLLSSKTLRRRAQRFLLTSGASITASSSSSYSISSSTSSSPSLVISMTPFSSILSFFDDRTSASLNGRF